MCGQSFYHCIAENCLPDAVKCLESANDSGSYEDTHEAIFGDAREARSSTSSIVPSPGTQSWTPSGRANNSVELEAVISCTSDGLVVCLRKARSMIPHSANLLTKPMYDKGLFNAPWAREPMLSPSYSRQVPGFATGFAPSQGLKAAQYNSTSPLNTTAFGPDPDKFMGAIRDRAIFAWALTSINRGLGSVAEGRPHDFSTPKDGYEVWTNDTSEHSPADEGSMHRNGMYPGQERRMASKMSGDPGLGRSDSGSGGRVKEST
jgi:hypothetical protein